MSRTAALDHRPARSSAGTRLAWVPVLIALASLLAAPRVHAWGDEGHEVIALIAAHYLLAPTRERVRALLAQDRSALTPDTSLSAEATWADHFRDSDRNGARVRYRRTMAWHFVDLELGHPSLAQACHGFPPLRPGEPASQGPARDCVVDKIGEFSRELAAPATAPAERVRALQFLLHLVGDLHQPLHAADDHDRGGNRVRVVGAAERPGSLHHYWDSVFVRALEPDPQRLAARLIARITPADERAWQRGNPAEWAWQSYGIARRVAYGMLPPGRGPYRLSARYQERAEQAVALQLSRAGVRLALLLNRDLGPSTTAAR